jgi:putative heme-binding domain-containing protein
LRDLTSTGHLKDLLKNPRPGVRRAAVLALLEDGALGKEDVQHLTEDTDADIQKLASAWIKNTSGDAPQLLVKGVGVNSANVAAVTGTPPEIKPQAKPPTVDEALAAMATADAKRGRLLVLHPAGAGCIACHYIGGRGNHFGPDLTGIGSRAELKHLVQSIIEPSAVITEGFNSQVITTAQGVQSGVLLEESGLAITLGLPTGQRARIMRADITKQETLPISAMPPFGTMLDAQQCADIAAWLMGQKENVVGKKDDGKKKKKKADKEKDRDKVAAKPDDKLIASKEPLSGGMAQDRLLLMQGKDQIGEYVFADATVKRPFFSNMRAPGGIQVTRTFPPVEGVDATDHSNMHPGIWLGFGDINGDDFWRNKATIRHDEFTQAPAWNESIGGSGMGTLVFGTSSTLVASDGSTPGKLVSAFSVNTLLKEKPNYAVRLVIWKVLIMATECDLVLGDQEEMGFGVRVATPLTEKNGGVILNSTGLMGAKQAWGQPARWCDYSGMIDGHPAGVTIISTLEPTWWHARDYGLLVANSFGRNAMKQGEKSNFVIKRGDKREFTWVAVLHSGDFTMKAFMEDGNK